MERKENHMGRVLVFGSPKPISQEIEGRRKRLKEGLMAMYNELQSSLKADNLELVKVENELDSVTKELHKLRDEIQVFDVSLTEAKEDSLEAESNLYKDFTFGGGQGGVGIDGQVGGFNWDDLDFLEGFLDRLENDNLGLNDGLEFQDLDDGSEFGDLDLLKMVPGEVGDGGKRSRRS